MLNMKCIYEYNLDKYTVYRAFTVRKNPFVSLTSLLSYHAVYEKLYFMLD